MRREQTHEDERPRTKESSESGFLLVLLLAVDPNPATGVQEVPHKLPLSLMLGFCYVLPQGSYGHIPTCTVSPANIGAVSASFTLMR